MGMGGGGGGVWILTEFNDNPLNLYTLLRSFPCIALHTLLRTIHCIISTIQNAHVQGIVGFLAMRLSSPEKRMVMYSVEGGGQGGLNFLPPAPCTLGSHPLL